MKRDSRASLIIAIMLLVLPVLYVGIYWALVKPADSLYVEARMFLQLRPPPKYRTKGEWETYLFWPLEQIDRKARPGAWAEPKMYSAEEWDRMTRRNLALP